MSALKINSKKKVYQYLFWAYVFISGILFVLISQSKNSEIKSVESEISNKQLIIDSLNSDIDFRSELITADMYFIKGSYDTAVMLYDKLNINYVDDELQSLIEMRKRRTEEITLVKDSLVNNLKTYVYSFNTATNEKDSLLTKIEVLQMNYAEIIFKMRNDIDLLKKMNSDKEEELASKIDKDLLSFVNRNNNTIFYLGAVVNEQANGFGIGVYNTGGVYKGDWKNNMRFGQGSYEWKDGHKYVGEYVDDQRNGKGTYFWENGEKYIGGWKKGKRNGYGILYNKDGVISYEGEWVDGNVKIPN